MATGNALKWDTTNKKWTISIDEAAYIDVVENLTTEQIIANPVAAPAGIASKGILYYDSTLNTWMVKENNGAAKAIANLAAYAPPVTTKGDVFVFGAAADRLPIGSNYQILVPDSAVALGLKYFTPPACRLVSNANQAIANNTQTAVAFATEDYDNSSIHDNVTNNSRITIATAGRYIVTGAVLFAAHATGTRIVSVYKNGAFLSRGIQTGDPGNLSVSITYSDILSLAANDYIELYVLQISGGNLNAISGYCRFAASWIGV